MAFSSGLSVPTMSTHHPAGKERLTKKGKKRERGRMKPKQPKAVWSLFPTGCENKESRVGRSGLPLWFHTFKFLLSPPPPPPTLMPGGGMSEGGRGEKRRRRVLLKTVEGHWSLKFKVGTQTHTSTTKSSLIECVSG